MPPNVEKLDLKLAVTAWQTLWLEASTNQTRYDRVWQPAQQVLDELSANPPPAFTCFAGKYYMFPNESDGVAVNLFFTFTGDNDEVAYLGTLFDETANRVWRQMETERLALVNQDEANRYALTDPSEIMTEALFRRIPANAEDLDTQVATTAVKRYLYLLAPRLLGCELEWLPHESGIAIEQRIKAAARQTAQKSTREDRMRSIEEDELDQ